MTLDSEEIPPPMPLSWRPCGSGEPMKRHNAASLSASSAGRSAALKNSPLLVPPRIKQVLIQSVMDITVRWKTHRVSNSELNYFNRKTGAFSSSPTSAQQELRRPLYQAQRS